MPTNARHVGRRVAGVGLRHAVESTKLKSTKRDSNKGDVAPQLQPVDRANGAGPFNAFGVDLAGETLQLGRSPEHRRSGARYRRPKASTSARLSQNRCLTPVSIGPRRRQNQRHRRHPDDEDVGHRRIGGGGVLAVERQARESAPRCSRHGRSPDARSWRTDSPAASISAVEVVNAVALEGEVLEPDAADQREAGVSFRRSSKEIAMLSRRV